MSGLTTTRAPFIEEAQAHGELYIHQPYELYSDANHEAWRQLYHRMEDRWQRYANPRFLEGIGSLCLDPTRVPRLDDVNRFLSPLTGFKAKAVSGYVPSFMFFDCLRNREFPTTITIRDARHARLPARAGHLPRHRGPRADAHGPGVRGHAGALRRLRAHRGGDRVGNHGRAREDPPHDQHHKAMARFFWFTVEFGLMKSGDGLRVYGSGLLSSYGEIAHAIDSSQVQRYPVQLEWVINQYFEIDSYQPLLFVVDSFDHLFSLVDQLERWMRAGKLDNVAGGEPAVSEADLKSFLVAAGGK